MLNYRDRVKPLFDFVLAFLLLLLLSPIIILIVIILLYVNRGGVFFLQMRPGLNAIPFRIIKFKTMRDLYDIHGTLLPDQDRLSKVGRIIRSFSLDETLQFINVLKGDMSIVGPRPLLIKYVERFSHEQSRRHEVKPGITGLAQVNGRNAISWKEKLRLDVDYVDNLSFCLDMKILLMTIYSVFRRSGISASDHVTMEEFKGDDGSSF
jgi:lipopolysaccharide/colanic/teichoic acid biosynthesis glycosyltransferase